MIPNDTKQPPVVACSRVICILKRQQKSRRFYIVRIQSLALQQRAAAASTGVVCPMHSRVTTSLFYSGPCFIDHYNTGLSAYCEIATIYQ